MADQFPVIHLDLCLLGSRSSPPHRRRPNSNPNPKAAYSCVVSTWDSMGLEGSKRHGASGKERTPTSPWPGRPPREWRPSWRSRACQSCCRSRTGYQRCPLTLLLINTELERGSYQTTILYEWALYEPQPQF